MSAYIVFLFLLGPFCLAPLMPTARWLVGLVVLVSSIYLINILQLKGILPHTIEFNKGEYAPIVLMVSAGLFVLGIAARICTMSMQKRGFRFRYIAGVTILIITAPFTLSGYLAGKKAWINRAPDQACLETPHKVRIANSQFRILLDNTYGDTTVIYSKKMRHVLRTNKEHRWFCNTIKRDEKNINFSGLGFQFDYFSFKRKYCVGKRSTAPWVKQVCQYDRETQYNMLPVRAKLIAIGDRDHRLTTFAQAQAAKRSEVKNKFLVVHPRPDMPHGFEFVVYPTGYEFVVQPKSNTPDGNPLMAKCSGLGPIALQKRSFCTVRYTLEEGLILEFSFVAKQEELADRRDEIAATALAVDLWTRSYIDDQRW